MKKIVWMLLFVACLPFGLMAQNANDDLYFVPKKKEKKEKKAEKPAKVVVEEKKSTSSTIYLTPGTTVVVKDVEGNVRDVDEYNRRYTSRDNTFTMENDTLYIEEKPYDERGEWVNGFQGSQSDYEYAMRIVRFRNPAFGIPVSSPLYWDVVYGLPSWNWNVFDDGYYAYVFPTFSNSLWWDWRYSWHFSWSSAWHYNGWYWHHPYMGLSHWYHPYGYHDHWYHAHWHPAHTHHPHYGWAGVGGYWGNRRPLNGSSVYNPGVHSGRYQNSYARNRTSSSASNRRVVSAENRSSRNNYLNGTSQSSNRSEGTVRRSSGRVVTAKDGGSASSVRPQRYVNGNRNGQTATQKVDGTTGKTREHGVYTRPAEGRGSSYNRQSSTRSTVRNVNASSSRNNGAADRGAYRSSSSSSRSSYDSNSSSSSSRSSSSSYSRSSSSSSSRSSYSSGSERSSRSSSAGGGSYRSGGGSSRGGGRR